MMIAAMVRVVGMGWIIAERATQSNLSTPVATRLCLCDRIRGVAPA
jgi:hypothetical protein